MVNFSHSILLFLITLALASPVGEYSNTIEIPMSRIDMWKMPYAKIQQPDGVDVQLLIDTGSADTYFNSKKACKSGGCNEASNYTGIDDSNFKRLPEYSTVEMVYADGSKTSLQLGEDKIGLGGNYYTANYSINYDGKITDPKLGLGFIQNEAVINVNNEKPYLNLVPGLEKQNVVNCNAYSVGGDSLILGGYDANSIDNYQWTDMIDRSYSGADIYHADVEFDEFKLGNTNLFQNDTTNDSRFMSMDTGASVMFLEPQVYNSLVKALGADDPSSSTPTINCDNEKLKQDLSFKIGNVNLKLPAKKLTSTDENFGLDEGQCALMLSQAPKTGLNTMGGVLLEQLNVAYDLDNLKIGIDYIKKSGAKSIKPFCTSSSNKRNLLCSRKH